MTKRNTAKPVRVVSPIMEEQETSASTLQEWLDKEETVSDLLFNKGKEEGINKSYKSFKNCTFQNQIFSECKFHSSQLTDVRFDAEPTSQHKHPCRRKGIRSDMAVL